MFPVSLVCGNTMVLKPSERDPGAAMLIMELMNEAGFPPGVINVIHGQHEGLLASDAFYTQYTPPTWINVTVELRRRWQCVPNSQLAYDDCWQIRSTIWNWLLRLHSGLTSWILVNIDNFFNSDVIMSSLVLSPSSTAQEIVSWVTTADVCVHTADMMQLHFTVGKFVHTCQDYRQVQCESKKSPPLKFSENFSQTVGNF